jgi:hypothetical protein
VGVNVDVTVEQGVEIHSGEGWQRKLGNAGGWSVRDATAAAIGRKKKT